MPWQDNSGNGSDNTSDYNQGGPWGQPPRGGNGSGNGSGNGGRGPRRPSRDGEPPDLDELLEASRERLKRAFPGRRGGHGGRGGRGGGIEMNGKTFGLIAAAILILWGISGFYRVNPNQLAVVTTFGEFDKIATSGLNWHIPYPFQNAKTENVTDVRSANVPTSRSGGTGFMLTKDKNIVDVEMTVQWQIKPGVIPENGEFPGVAQFVFNIDDPQNLLVTVAEAAIREAVGANDLEYVRTNGRAEVQQQTLALMQSALDLNQAGIEVIEVNLERTAPPTREVDEAFLDVKAAEQDQEQFINTARSYQNRVVPQARGQAQRILEEARGYQFRVTAEARGQAERFEKIYAEYAKAPQVTRQRMYLETTERVLATMDKIIIEEGAGSGVVPYLPLNELQKGKSQ